MIVIGVDPGAMTGLAVVADGQLTDAVTIPWRTAPSSEPGAGVKAWLREAREAGQSMKVIVEVPVAGYFERRGVSRRGQYRIAQNVGECRAKAEVIAGFCEGLGYTVIRKSPIRGGTKRAIALATWRAIFKWVGRAPSSHARDAAVLALEGKQP